MAGKAAKTTRTSVRKSTAKSTDVPVGALIPQPHGGAIRNGGTNKGGTGRPPDELRQRLRAIGFEKGVPFLDKLMDGEILFQVACSRCGQTDVKSDKALEEKLREEIRASVDHRLKAMEQLFRYGLGTKDEVNVADDPRVKALIQRVASLVLEIAGPEVHALIAERLTAEGL